MKDIYIDPSSTVFDCDLGSSSRIYKNCYLNKCTIYDKAIVGDFSRIERSLIGAGVRLQRFGMIYDSSIGRLSYTGRNFTAWHTTIGSFCSISWNVSIGGANHDYRKVTTHPVLYGEEFGFLNGQAPLYDRFGSECIVGNDVWIGCNAVIMRGVQVGDGAVIGSGAVVTRDVEPYSINVGAPARKIAMRFEDDYAERIQATKWWELPDEAIRKNLSIIGSRVNEEIVAYLEEICRYSREPI